MMGKTENLIGQKFGNYLVLSIMEDREKYKRITYECKCDCGNVRFVSASNLIGGKSRSCGCYRFGKRRKDLIGQKFGYFLVISMKYAERLEEQRLTKCECICDCGNIKYVLASSLINGTSKSCGCYKSAKMSTRLRKYYGEMSGQYFASIKCGASKRKLEFNITKEYLWNLFLEQDRKCALSGEELVFCKNYKDQINQTASIDRIDSSLGYIEGNIQWVHKRVNFMKQELEDSVLIEWCRKIYEYSKNNQLTVRGGPEIQLLT